MKKLALVIALVMSLAAPSFAHGFGLLKLALDAIYNQLGLDRGPIPKVPPPSPSGPCGGKPCPEEGRTPPRIHIQADGF
jgi:hypothetical protein